MVNQIPMPKGVLVIKDISCDEFDRLLTEWKAALESIANDALDKIMIIGGHEVEYIPFEDKALKLWQELFNYIGYDPFVNDTTDHGYDPTCYFCNETKPHHETDCVYVKAKLLLEAAHE